MISGNCTYSGTLRAFPAALALLASLALPACASGLSGGGGGADGGAGGGATSTASTGGAGGAVTSTGGTGGSAGGISTKDCIHTNPRLRIVAANLSSGNAQSWDPGHGIRILQGVHGDVMLMQEMNYGDNSPAKQRELADAVCGTECAFVRGAGQIPNGVVSRHPIIASGEWTDPKVSNRDFVWARLDVPGPVDLWAVSVHLLTSSATARAAEASALVSLIQVNVPAGDHVVVGGDFNTSSRSEAAIATFGSLLSVAAPYPVDGNGNGNTNASRAKPYDWVLPSPELRAKEAPVLIGAAHFDMGLVVDTRVYTPISDLAPAEPTDSGALNMQHMAVVRDFLIQ